MTVPASKSRPTTATSRHSGVSFDFDLAPPPPGSHLAYVQRLGVHCTTITLRARPSRGHYSEVFPFLPTVRLPLLPMLHPSRGNRQRNPRADVGRRSMSLSLAPPYCHLPTPLLPATQYEQHLSNVPTTETSPRSKRHWVAVWKYLLHVLVSRKISREHPWAHGRRFPFEGAAVGFITETE